jgi:pimeloyl-ACP methyl ester carboxylesterase
MQDLFVSTHGPEGADRVVMVHGSLDRSAGFIRVERMLRDVQVVRYDRRGYAHSSGAGLSSSIDALVADLGSVVDGRPCVLFGHSLGGIIALTFAERAPHLVRAVLAYESPMPWTDWWPSWSAGGAALDGQGNEDPSAAAERFMRRMIGDDHWERLPEGTRAQRRAEGPALLADLHAIRPPAPPPYDPARITMPVVVAHGSEGRTHHRQGAEHLADLVPGAELVVVPGAGHGVHLSDPAAVAGLVRHTLARAASVEAPRPA